MSAQSSLKGKVALVTDAPKGISADRRRHDELVVGKVGGAAQLWGLLKYDSTFRRFLSSVSQALAANYALSTYNCSPPT